MQLKRCVSYNNVDFWNEGVSCQVSSEKIIQGGIASQFIVIGATSEVDLNLDR